MTEIETSYGRKTCPKQYESIEARLSIRETADPLKPIDTQAILSLERSRRLVEDFMSGKMSEVGFTNAGGTVERKIEGKPAEQMGMPAIPQGWPESVICKKCSKLLRGYPDKYNPKAMRYWCKECKEVTSPPPPEAK